MGSQLELQTETMDGFLKFKELMPHIRKPYEELSAETYKDGALDEKTKRLMALVGALVHGCRACILFQTERAMELGAGVEEILESCAVAVSLGGTMAAGETTRVVQLLMELGKIE